MMGNVLSSFFTGQTLKAMQFIANSPEQFHLTGSRFFCHSTDKSDWDFFVQQSNGIENKLREAGFKRIYDPNTGDIIDPSYMGLCEVLSLWENGQVHVQVVLDADKKVKIQDMIKKNVFMKNLDKVARKQLWRVAYAMAAMFLR